VPGVDVRRAAVDEEPDDILRLRGMMPRPRRERPRGVGGRPLRAGVLLLQHAGEAEEAEAAADAREEFAAGGIFEWWWRPEKIGWICHWRLLSVYRRMRLPLRCLLNPLRGHGFSPAKIFADIGIKSINFFDVAL